VSTLVPAYSATRFLRNSTEHRNSEDSSYARAVAIVLGLLARFVSLLLLLGLLGITGVVWCWLASFRSGWRLGDWLDQQPNNQDKLALNVLHGSIVALFSPLAIFGDWSQKLMSEKFQIQFPPKIDLRQIIQQQLGVKLSEDSPCLPDRTNSSDDSALSGELK
jgi:hypothetical protein